jgi:Rod binding domain-containing protein
MRIDPTMTAPIGVDQDARDRSRLVDAAQQFEALMAQELLKPMTSTENKWDTGEEEGDKSMDTMSSYGTEAVAKAIAKGGGLGIAKKVVEQVTADHDNRMKKREG